MPTWGWFVVALVLIDAAVLAAWLLARKRPGTRTESTASSAPLASTAVLWADIEPTLRTLKHEGNSLAAIKLLRSRTGLPLREAKEAVDRL
ncbi:MULTISPECIES: hypothetical protein [Nocardiaceae]|jgi:ribosomal protein L7/L12|uniref:hypothetical protein n=1 Tax=Nocardiaceae TaxID=85025 RepID=UPI00055F3326|nr:MULTISPECIES: hypothetical protein [Rhodococcus]OZE94562.1 hypothetical protein CH301_24480 [Rhodococcus sp. 15-1189-1-1a]OZF09646.1 hypothetical protein CH299_25000 [Rhodococcus sp. 14-2686-1-2]OZF44052.1 hypothetical protein CH293_24255 [Rhodococcus sp. 14-2470-1b]